MNHDKDILTNHGKISNNLMQMVAKNDCLLPDSKGHYYPHALYIYYYITCSRLHKIAVRQSPKMTFLYRFHEMNG